MGGTGAAMMPGPMAGASAHGTASIKLGLEALQKGLPELPMGSDLHASVLKAVADISKHMGTEGNPAPGRDEMMQQLVQMAHAGPPGAPPPGLGAPPPPGGMPPPGPPPPGL